MRWMKSTARSRMTEHRNKIGKSKKCPKLTIRHRQVLERFVDTLPAEVAQGLDFTPVSLDVVENWILTKYASIAQMLSSTEAGTVDGLARYVGETFRKAIGGRWSIRLDDSKYAFYGLPEMIGYSDKPTSLCPICSSPSMLSVR